MKPILNGKPHADCSCFGPPNVRGPYRFFLFTKIAYQSQSIHYTHSISWNVRAFGRPNLSFDHSIWAPDITWMPNDDEM